MVDGCFDYVVVVFFVVDEFAWLTVALIMLLSWFLMSLNSWFLL